MGTSSDLTASNVMIIGQAALDEGTNDELQNIR